MSDVNITFDDGIQTVMLNNDPDRIIKWNPSDMEFIDRFMAFQSYVDQDLTPKITQIYETISQGNGMTAYKQGAITELGQIFNNELDKAFGYKVSEKAFMGASPLSSTKNGNLIFMNFLDALTPLIEQSTKDFESARGKYTEKYRPKK